MSTTRQVIIDGITYTITDNSPTSGLSDQQVADIIENLHKTSYYSNAMNDLKATGKESDKHIEVEIDAQYGGKPVPTAISRKNEAINLNSSDFTDGAKNIITKDGDIMENTVDTALAHEIGHLHDARVNGADLTETEEENKSEQEKYAINFENEIRKEVDLPERSLDNHADIDPEKYEQELEDTLQDALKGDIKIIDPDADSGDDANILSDDQYGSSPPAPEENGSWLDTVARATKPYFDQIAKSTSDEADDIRDFLETVFEDVDLMPDPMEYPFLYPPSFWIIYGVLELIKTPENEASPLILDLGATGIELTDLNGSDAVYWEFNGK